MALLTRAGARLAAAAVAAGLLTACTASVVTGHGEAGPAGRSGAPSGTPTPGTPLVPSQPLADFVDCTSGIPLGLPAGRGAKLRFGCARISVPLDYSHPAGRTITLQLLRIHDTDNHAPTGSLLINPGGPGGSGVEFAFDIVGALPEALLKHFDIVGFDPRGVGLSDPIDCQSDKQQDHYNAASPDTSTTTGFAAATQLAKQYADRCSAKYGSTLGEYNTVQAAMDMDEIRQAVGDRQMNYLGFSYGTELGAQYVHLFPSKVRVAVLDGAVDPLADYRQMLAEQMGGFDDAFGQFATWCAARAQCNTLGNPRAALTKVLAAAKKAPLPSSAGSRKATVNLIEIGVSEALYSKLEWPTLGSALLAARAGDGKGLLALADEYFQRRQGHYASLEDVYNVVSCNDSKPGPSDALMRATAREWSARYPMFASSVVPQLLLCQQWHAHRTVPSLPTAPTTRRKILVVGNLHDPATPYRGAQDLTKTLGNAELLSWNGEGHTSYLHGSSCIDNYVDAYLINGTLPPSGKTCPR